MFQLGIDMGSSTVKLELLEDGALLSIPRESEHHARTH